MTSEQDPQYGSDLKRPGTKADAAKRDMTYLKYFPRALREVCRVCEEGAKKYTRDGWRCVENGIERYEAAIGRHYLPEDGSDIDVDTGCYHLAQIAWNALAALELKLQDGLTNEND